MSSSKEKKSLLTKITMLPKVIRTVILVVALVAIFSLGLFSKEILSITTKTTKFGLEDVGELVTQTAYLTVVDEISKYSQVFNKKIPLTQSRQIFSYDVQVDASVDFSKIELAEGINTITVKLPHAKVYKATLDEESLHVFLDSGSLFTRIKLEDQGDARKKMQDNAIKDAEANGLLEAADKNAKRLISSMIKSNSKYKNYEIEYEYID